MFWKVQYVTSQTCVWGLQSEAQKSCKTFVLNHTDWDSHHQTKMSPRPLVRWCWCQVSCLFAEKLLVRLWVLSAQQNKSWRHAWVLIHNNCVSRRDTVNKVTVRDCLWPTDIESRDNHFSWRTGTQVTTPFLQNFCCSFCSPHTQVCEVDVPNFPKHQAVSKTNQ